VAVVGSNPAVPTKNQQLSIAHQSDLVRPDRITASIGW
jgi:hypothetical protein